MSSSQNRIAFVPLLKDIQPICFQRTPHLEAPQPLCICSLPSLSTVLLSLQYFSTASYCGHEEYAEYFLLQESFYGLEDHIISFSLSLTYIYVYISIYDSCYLSFLLPLGILVNVPQAFLNWFISFFNWNTQNYIDCSCWNLTAPKHH